MYIGIDLGGTNIAAGAVTREGKIAAQDSVPTLKDRDPREIAADMVKLSEKVARRCSLNLSDMDAIGIGCPGTIDFEKGEVVYSNNIKMEHFMLSNSIHEHTDLPVFVDNDANCAAMGEYLVNGGGVDNFLFITLGTGVGSGLVLNGSVFRGFNGAAVEAGHMTLVSGGIRCSCGKQGCWESYASVTALIEQTKSAMAENPDSVMNEIARQDGKVSGKTAFGAAKLGDKAAIEVVNRYARYVADGIVSMENIFQPDTIVIGGGISREGDRLLNPVREYVRENGFNKFMKKTEIKAATLFNDAGIIGAAAIAMN